VKPGRFRQSILVESVGRLRTAAGIIAGVWGVTARLDFQNGCPGLGKSRLIFRTAVPDWDRRTSLQSLCDTI